MKKVIVIGSGISGLSAAIHCAERGCFVTLCSPYPSERAQSVMAAGGINAVLSTSNQKDSISCHEEDTFFGGCEIDSKQSIHLLCEAAPKEIEWLSSIGVAFNHTKDGAVAQRAFGGQTYHRTCYAGASTGKQIVSALVFKCREYEAKGLIKRRMGVYFYEALIINKTCHGCLLFDEKSKMVTPLYADALCIATGGQNLLFGKTTGSLLCDGFAAAKLFEQGVLLRNLEFIQYHPTTIETIHKRMLISEAARGEGGRLYYEQDGKRIYFMEEKYGKNGNLMPRDVVAKCIYDAPSQVYLDVTFLGEKCIQQRLLEIYEICKEYAFLDITKESIPVYPSVHFFMGGIDVDDAHMTNVSGLYAVGECAGKYHGANRLGGNSLLAALYSGRAFAKDVSRRPEISEETADFSKKVEEVNSMIKGAYERQSKFPTIYIEQEIANIMNQNLGITRTKEGLLEGLSSVDYYLAICQKVFFDSDVTLYRSLRLLPLLNLSKAILTAALSREESRGAHVREDFPDRNEAFAASSLASYQDGKILMTYRKENE